MTPNRPSTRFGLAHCDPDRGIIDVAKERQRLVEAHVSVRLVGFDRYTLIEDA